MTSSRTPSRGLMRILLLEDDPRDEELIREALRGLPQKVSLERVETVKEFVAAIDAGGWRVILSDFSLADFDGLAALALVRERSSDVPFIMVSGSLPEERLIELIRMRGTDYVSKDRLLTLPHAIDRALRELEHAQRAREAEERARLLIDAAVEAIFTLDAGARVKSANPAAQRLTGYEESELVGKSARMFIPEESHQAFDRLASDHLSWGGRLELEQLHEFELLTKDGLRVPVEISASEFHSDRKRFFALFARDLTERRSMEEQLRQSQKLEAIGSLAAGIAHDFNNVLAVVNGYSGLALDRLEPNSETWAHVDQIRVAGEHAARLTSQLLAFSRKQVTHPEVLSLRDLVVELAPMLQRVLGERIALEMDADSETPLVRADASQLQQVLFNLTINARDAMPEGGRLRIEAAAAELDEEGAAIHPGMRPGRFAALTVVDTGNGMTPEVQKRIFEPFFTTKGVGRGTGLGLATVHGIVRQSGGWIWFYSEEGEGTTFKVFLPALVDSAVVESRPASVAGPCVAQPGECIVVVEDDPGVRAVVARLLTGSGYEVLEFASGSEAIDRIAGSDRRVDLLLSDLVMPDMSGDELALTLRRERPSLAVLFMSGYAEDLVAGRLASVEPYSHVAKPFSASALRETVRRLLDAQAADP